MLHTMATTLTGRIKPDVFFARSRRFATSLDAALAPNHIPAAVFHNVIRAFRDNLGTWHRYWRVRQRALRLETLKPYDTRAPLAPPIKVPYQQSVDWISAA